MEGLRSQHPGWVIRTVVLGAAIAGAWTVLTILLGVSATGARADDTGPLPAGGSGGHSLIGATSAVADAVGAASRSVAAATPALTPVAPAKALAGRVAKVGPPAVSHTVVRAAGRVLATVDSATDLTRAAVTPIPVVGTVGDAATAPVATVVHKLVATVDSTVREVAGTVDSTTGRLTGTIGSSLGSVATTIGTVTAPPGATPSVPAAPSDNHHAAAVAVSASMVSSSVMSTRAGPGAEAFVAETAAAASGAIGMPVTAPNSGSPGGPLPAMSGVVSSLMAGSGAGGASGASATAASSFVTPDPTAGRRSSALDRSQLPTRPTAPEVSPD